MSFEPRRCIGRTVVYGIVQEALPFEESKVPGKVPDLSMNIKTWHVPVCQTASKSKG